MNKQLYMFYLGGNAGRSNIEVHDVQFAACADYRDALPALKAAWFGDAGKIHIDGWQVIDWADGYDVFLSDAPDTRTGLNLYFVNVGGYVRGRLAEAHDFALFVAESAEAAKAKALRTLLPDHDLRHKDNLKDVDNVLLLKQIDGAHIGLRANPHGKAAALGFQGYLPI
ncbi:DUF1543 domain-containing protein [Conchiformibius kuhniae]|uniref:DUF1543 domain-containing protein n=1 Tax=Conchiformibius kuhniae TaxID=211502 RepID=A0A8T9MU41_9NEIS|nr:DUF1543 domain-containing protein [Conchiformibius kuhniae]UOP04809.1 DUF1543 domain-containing protein [Conchiformibius kuhniae]